MFIKIMTFFAKIFLFASHDCLKKASRSLFGHKVEYDGAREAGNWAILSAAAATIPFSDSVTRSRTVGPLTVDEDPSSSAPSVPGRDSIKSRKTSRKMSRTRDSTEK